MPPLRIGSCSDAQADAVLNALMKGSVDVIATFTPAVRDRYMRDLRDLVRDTLTTVFGQERSHG